MFCDNYLKKIVNDNRGRSRSRVIGSVRRSKLELKAGEEDVA